MTIRNLIATRDQRYGTRMLRAGQPMQADNDMSRILMAVKRARLPTNAEHKKYFSKKEEPQTELQSEAVAEATISEETATPSVNRPRTRTRAAKKKRG